MDMRRIREGFLVYMTIRTNDQMVLDPGSLMTKDLYEIENVLPHQILYDGNQWLMKLHLEVTKPYGYRIGILLNSITGNTSTEDKDDLTFVLNNQKTNVGN